MELQAHTQVLSLCGNTRAIDVFDIGCTSALTLRPHLMQGKDGVCFYLFSVREDPLASIPVVAITSARLGIEFAW